MNKERLENIMNRAQTICNKKGVVFTKQRRTVLELICKSNKPISAYDILYLMGKNIKNPAPPTVYRALGFLLKQGLVHKIESLHAFVICIYPEHKHSSWFLICTDCGKTKEVEDNVISKGFQLVEKQAGFYAKKAIVELLGICNRCKLGPEH